MHILGVGAHYDDLELGCSGTLIKHVQRGDKVTMLVVTDSAYTNPNGKVVRSADVAYEEGKSAAAIIGADLVCLNYKTFMVKNDEDLTRALLDFVEDNNIEVIYSHWVGDIHRDHKVVANVSLMAGRHVKRHLMYRSNHYDTEAIFRGNYYSDITDVIEKKVEAILAHKSEIERTHRQWVDFFRNQNYNDGLKIGVEYAECFEIVRYLE